ncbi:hypothetical protein GUJ93_ZPchr0006g46068 [Zizania palustris]|uniref:Uncharacterized protein n=1 Tax=Zizania palustris TaxID=103762 RepID=A0A8J5TB24_ZIZPA|nr:hypothetical protein GUJ93_ZPchr0006g46068 [Zizania palustris]
MFSTSLDFSLLTSELSSKSAASYVRGHRRHASGREGDGETLSLRVRETAAAAAALCSPARCRLEEGRPPLS